MWRAKFPLFFYAISLVGFSGSTALAQTVPDNTLGSESSTVNPDVTIGNRPVDLIEGGATRGNNLFHSFSEFNVGDGNAVYFANPDGVANILTRVTGNNPSEILGILGVDGTANLFLLNPNGIVFGENAQLDLNGSFLATTADSYLFENEFEYSATNPKVPPLLTVNIPMGLQFGSKAEAIEVRGTGNNIGFDPEIFEPTWDTRTKGLEVDSGNTLALIGGEINLEGGNLTAAQGRIELASIAETGNISLTATDNGFSLDGRENTNFKDINLTQSASIDTSGNRSGNLQLQGKKIALLNGSGIFARTLGDDNGREVKIHATDSVKIAGTNAKLFSSEINNDVEASATGNGGNLAIAAKNIELLGGFVSTNTFGIGKAGNLNIDADRLQIKDGSQIASATWNAGDGGDISVFAKNIEVLGGSQDSSSGLRTDTFATGKGGNLIVDADRLQVKDGGQIGSVAWNAGDGGDISVFAKNIEVLGGSQDGSSGLRTDTFATGKGGNLIIDADRLQIKDGGQIGSGVWNAGDGGNVLIRATNVEVIGFQLINGIPYPSGIFTPVSPSELDSKVTGKGGNLTIDAEQLIVRDRGLISSYTAGQGNAGNIDINVQKLKVDSNAAQVITTTYGNGNAGKLTIRAAESVEITGTGLFSDFRAEGQFDLVSSGLFASVESGATGNGGNLTVITGNLNISEGGKIVANTLSSGNAGNIFIRAHNLEVRDTVVDDIGTRSGINSTVEKESTGNGGHVDIVANNLQLIDGGLISVDSLGQGNAGNITIKSQNIDVSGVSSGEPVFGIQQPKLPSSISAFSGGNFNAGLIAINTDTLNISDRGLISVSNLGNGNSGNLNITASELNLDNSATLEAKVNAGNQGNIQLTTDNIFLSNDSEINVLATGTATGGNIKIDNSENMVVTKNSRILANAIQGKGGNIEIMTQGYFVSGDSLVSASSEFGLDGNINVENINGDRPLELDQLPENLIDRTQQIAKTCGAGKNQFAIAGRGGLPENPLQNLRGQTVWQDLRVSVASNNAAFQDLSSSNLFDLSDPILVEADSWQVSQQGKVELFARHQNRYRSNLGISNLQSCWQS